MKKERLLDHPFFFCSCPHLPHRVVTGVLSTAVKARCLHEAEASSLRAAQLSARVLCPGPAQSEAGSPVSQACTERGRETFVITDSVSPSPGL